MTKDRAKKKDRLRNKFFRWVGLVPRDDYTEFGNKLIKTLLSFEKFTISTNLFCNDVAQRLGIKFDGKVSKKVGKSENDIEEEYRERGMI